MKQKTGRKLLSFLLTLALVIGLMPGMGLTAFAYEGDPYASLVNTTTPVTFNGKSWYIIADNSTAVDAGTVTLLAADVSFGNSAFGSNNVYSTSTVKGYLDKVIEGTAGEGKPDFSGVATAIKDTDNGKLYLLDKTEADNVSENVRKYNSNWWLRSPGGLGTAAFVTGRVGIVRGYGIDVSEEYGVRPALKLNLSSVIFKSESGSYSFVLKPSHTHSFTYSASGATITATCNGTGTCDITEGLTLTISAPTGSLVYDGTTTYPATLSTGYNTTAFPGTYSISYKKDGSAYSGVPKDAGTYTASVTAGTGDAAKTASVSYTVTKAAATVTKAPAAKTLTYTGSAQALVDAGTASGGEMQYALGTATEATQPYTTSIPTKTDVGTYYVWYKAVGDGNHLDTAPKCITVIISPKAKPQTEPQTEPQPQPAPESQPQQPTSVTSEDFSLIMNSDFLVSWKGSKVMVRWGTVPGADFYEVYADYCGSHSIEKVLTVPGGNSTEIPLIDGKKPNPKNCVKAYVVAYRNGVPIGKTLQGHAAGRNYNATNVKRIKASKKTYKLALGKSKKLKIKTVKMKRRKKMIEKWHCDPLRYASSDETVATVTKKGKIKAVGKGSCEIWAYAQNGRSCKVTVVVK